MKYLIALFAVVMLTSCKSPEARYPVTHSSGSFIKKSAERNKKLNEAEQLRIEKIMSSRPEIDYIASNNGFWYYYDVRIEADSITPQFGDLVSFNYNVSDLDGNVIYTETDLKTQNYTIDQEELFSGLREGLKLMKAGETVTFLFPSQLAYGYYGDENKIGTNIPLKCRVKMNSITQKDANK